MLTPKSSNFRPSYKNKVDFDSPTKNTSISVLTLKPSKSISPTQHQVNFDPNTEVKLISIPILRTRQFGMPPRHENEVNSDPDSKPSRFRPPQKNKVNSDPYTEIKSIPIPHTEIKSISTTHTTKSISMPMLKPCHFCGRVTFRVTHTSTCFCDTAARRII